MTRNEALLASLRPLMPGYSETDLMLIVDLAHHAAHEAMSTMRNVCGRTPGGLKIEALTVALIVMRHNCETALKTIVETLEEGKR